MEGTEVGRAFRGQGIVSTRLAHVAGSGPRGVPTRCDFVQGSALPIQSTLAGL